MATSTFTLLLRSDLPFYSFFVVLHVHRNHMAYWGRGKNGTGHDSPDPPPCSRSSSALKLLAVSK